jgi:quinol monooxygenase YgiN
MNESTELMGIARFTFHEGMVDEFRRLSALCLEIVREQDTGTLQYDTYIDADGTHAVVIERYRDAQALLEHGEHIGPEMMEAVMRTGTIEGELLGDPGTAPELRRNLEDAPVRLLALHASLTE